MHLQDAPADLRWSGKASGTLANHVQILLGEPVQRLLQQSEFFLQIDPSAALPFRLGG
jgi:hypothetical protein